MYRTITPRSADQWINAIAQADWSDPSNPEWLPRDEHPPVTVAGKIAGALRKYYKALFSRKTPEPAAKMKARAALNPTRGIDRPTDGVASACTRISFLSFPFELRGPPFITRNSFSRRFRQAMRH